MTSGEAAGVKGYNRKEQVMERSSYMMSPKHLATGPSWLPPIHHTTPPSPQGLRPIPLKL